MNECFRWDLERVQSGALSQMPAYAVGDTARSGGLRLWEIAETLTRLPPPRAYLFLSSDKLLIPSAIQFLHG